MENKIIYRNADADFSVVDDSRRIEGKAVCFDSWSRDLGGFKEKINRGAITQELVENSDVIMNINHDNDTMVARSRNGQGTLSLDLREDGLYFAFDAPPTERGNELLYNVKSGNYSECSFAFTLADDENCQKWYKDAESDSLCREINNIGGLYDCSIVTLGAYSDTWCDKRDAESVNVGDILAKLALDYQKKEQEEREAKQKEIEERYKSYTEKYNQYIQDEVQ